MNAHKFPEAFHIIFGQLDWDAQLVVRVTCRTYCHRAQHLQVGPYILHSQFAMATTGTFTPNDPIKDQLDEAWYHYRTIIDDSSMLPACFYRLRDCDMKSHTFIAFKQGEAVRARGRLYAPYRFHELHKWAYNATWLLANLHKGRSIVILSEIDSSSLFRKTRGCKDTVSAFAREIAGALSCGYTATINHSLQRIELIPTDDDHKRLRANTATVSLKQNETIQCYSGLMFWSQNKLPPAPKDTSTYRAQW